MSMGRWPLFLGRVEKREVTLAWDQYWVSTWNFYWLWSAEEESKSNIDVPGYNVLHRHKTTSIHCNRPPGKALRLVICTYLLWNNCIVRTSPFIAVFLIDMPAASPSEMDVVCIRIVSALNFSSFLISHWSCMFVQSDKSHIISSPLHLSRSTSCQLLDQPNILDHPSAGLQLFLKIHPLITRVYDATERSCNQTSRGHQGMLNEIDSHTREVFYHRKH